MDDIDYKNLMLRIEKFYNYIYKDATIFLGRKRNKIYTYLNK